MMPNPEDAFDDENAPPIPQLGDSGADISDEAREKAAQEAAEQNRTPETQKFIDTIFGSDTGDSESAKRRSEAFARGITPSQSSDGGSDQLLEEVRAIRSAIEALLNS